MKVTLRETTTDELALGWKMKGLLRGKLGGKIDGHVDEAEGDLSIGCMAPHGFSIG